MPRYSDEIIDEVRQTNDIVDFISERVKGFFGNILKSKYKDVSDN